MSGKLHWELGRPAARKRPQESDEAVVALRRVMTAERRVSTCKRKRLEQASEGRLVSKKPVTEEEMREIAARQRLPAFPHLALVRERLSVKAKNEPKFRFYCLYGLVVETETLKCAWQKVRANGGAAGVDGVTIEDIERSEGSVDGFIAEIQRELHEKAYRASPVRTTYIEKANGKLRPLGIPTVKDRVVQNAVLLIIEPISEADFHDCSYGFRPYLVLAKCFNISGLFYFSCGIYGRLNNISLQKRSHTLALTYGLVCAVASGYYRMAGIKCIFPLWVAALLFGLWKVVFLCGTCISAGAGLSLYRDLL